ncbi:hypothetical protein N0K71_07315 [Dellaglioa algida]|uniref:hypothetical protein n=1 Tax=Dellaglioa algida TaxID=105612 RepID=UPI000716F612|nr:hypothetical protein [Dellaglioa algida]MDK1733429.1 hypothetical protein [Dellaglioa algida]MDK1734950.1 hypothetical protein [Dellaglioa algida]
MKNKIIMGFMIVLGMITLSACGSNTLDGKYTYKSNTYTFKDNRVEQTVDGKIAGPAGTYTVSGNKIIMKLANITTEAKLIDGKKAFSITSLRDRPHGENILTAKNSKDGLKAIPKRKYIKE